MREVTGAAVGRGAHDEVIEQLNLPGGGGQARRAGQALVRVTGGRVSAGVVVYENEGIRGVNDGGFENFPWMRKSLVDRTLRKFFELDQPKAGIKQDHGEDFAIKGAHFRTESVINALRVVKMLLVKGISAGQGAEAQCSNQSGGLGLREEA